MFSQVLRLHGVVVPPVRSHGVLFDLTSRLFGHQAEFPAAVVHANTPNRGSHVKMATTTTEYEIISQLYHTHRRRLVAL
jgi:hypothetical protein